MDISNIQEIWKQYETQLNSARELNITLLKEVKLDNAKSSLKSLLFLPISTIFFFVSVTSYAMYFTIIYPGTWYYKFSGAVVIFFSLLYILSSIKQLKLILSVDYNTPVVKIQADIAQIKTSVVTNLRIAAWLLPFSPFIGLFFFNTLFNFDLMVLVNYNMMISFGVIIIFLEIISLMLLRALRPKNINKKWLNWLLKGSGSQVDETLNFLNQIKEFETEEY